jgi:hypothetical protein
MDGVDDRAGTALVWLFLTLSTAAAAACAAGLACAAFALGSPPASLA